MQCPTVDLVDEAAEGAGRELNRSSVECMRAGLYIAGLSLLSGTHPAPLDTERLGAGVSNKVEALVLIMNLKGDL